MAIIKLHESLGDVRIDLKKSGLQAFLGLEQMVDREITNLCQRFPGTESEDKIIKARRVFEWIIPSPDSSRYVKNSGWIKRPIRYNADRVINVKTDSPTINCFGFSILGTLMSRKLGLESNVVGVEISATGAFTEHCCYALNLDSAENILIDPSHYKEDKIRSFDAEHKRFQIMNDEDVFNLLVSYHYMATNELLKEIQLSEALCKSIPDSITLLSGLALGKYIEGKKLSALNLHLKAIEIFPEFIESLKEVADIYTELGEIDDAIEYYKRASRIKRLYETSEVNNGKLEYVTIEHPSRIEAMLELGAIYIDKGRHTEALNYLSSALGFKEEYAKYTTDKDADTLYNIGTAYDNKGDMKNAIRYYQLAFKASPRDAESRNRLAEAYAYSGKIDKALELGPTGADAFYYIGEYYERKDRIGLAKEWYEDSLRINPKDTCTLNALGNVCMTLGFNNKAIDCFNKTLKYDPKNKEAKKYLSQLS